MDVLMMKERIVATYRKMDDNWTKEDFDYHSHDRFEIYRFHSGNCKYLIGDRIYQLQQGDLIIMNGLTLHRANPIPTEPYERSVIEFSPEWIQPTLDTLQLPELLSPFYKLNNSIFREVDSSSRNKLDGLIKRIAELVAKNRDQILAPYEENMESRLLKGEVSTLLIQCLFSIYELSQSRLRTISPNESEKDRHVERIVSWVGQHFDQNTSLDSIAEGLNISKYYMARTFKEVTGLTIMQYIMNCRMNRAKYLLEMNPEKTILDVALESGFENSSHFSRFFRQHLRVTPTEYRRRKSSAISVKSAQK
jgi:AraC-like DNA-binding protein